MMNLLDLLQTKAANALSLTLLHSLWQCAVVLLVVRAVLRFIKTEKATLRYSIAAGAMVIMLLFFVGTFVTLYHGGSDQSVTSAHTELIGTGNGTAIPTATTFSLSTGAAVVLLIRSYVPLLWLAGTVFFILRTFAGWWYLSRLQRSLTLLNNDWAERLIQLKRKLGITKNVLLAESERVVSPIAMGVLRPVIILPMGLTTGFSSAQIETILIHELYHIRRNDYLVNLFQTMVEAILFFNPFVWVVSSIIREEREHCCDDAVIRSGVNKKDYVYVLAALEEFNHQNLNLSLPLARSKNQLLYRIKRLMEKTVTKYPVREKLVPVLFVALGLICASWFSIQRGDTGASKRTTSHTVEQDTTIRKKTKSAVYSRKKKVTMNSDGTPKEEIVEEFEGDEALRPMINDPAFTFDFDFPAFNEMDFVMPPFPDADIMNPHLPPMTFHFDSLPPGHSLAQWQAFQEEFQKKFQERFADFYKKNGEEMEKMMEDIRKEFEAEHGTWQRSFMKHPDFESRAMEEQSRLMEHHAREMEALAERMEEEHSRMEHVSREMEEVAREQGERAREMEKHARHLEQKMNDFQSELNKELIKDGYIKNSEEVKTIDWRDDGDIRVNGTKIREDHRKKYEAIHEKYFGKDKGNFQLKN
jgi:bla regulator protein blaR1